MAAKGAIFVFMGRVKVKHGRSSSALRQSLGAQIDKKRQVRGNAEMVLSLGGMGRDSMVQ